MNFTNCISAWQSLWGSPSHVPTMSPRQEQNRVEFTWLPVTTPSSSSVLCGLKQPPCPIMCVFLPLMAPVCVLLPIWDIYKVRLGLITNSPCRYGLSLGSQVSDKWRGVGCCRVFLPLFIVRTWASDYGPFFLPCPVQGLLWRQTINPHFGYLLHWPCGMWNGMDMEKAFLMIRAEAINRIKIDF